MQTSESLDGMALSTLSARAATEQDEQKRLPMYLKTVERLSAEWWQNARWAQERTHHGALAARQHFEDEHHTFALRYPMMFQKIVHHERRFDSKEQKTLEEWKAVKEAELAAQTRKDKEQVNQTFVEYAARKYMKPFLKPGVAPVEDDSDAKKT